MLPPPILRRELRASAHRKELFLLRVVMAVAAGAILVAYGAFALGERMFTQSVYAVDGLRQYGVAAMATVLVAEGLLLGFLVPNIVGAAIAEERERSTLMFLLLSRLTRSEIVLVKLIGRLLPAVSLALVGAPYLAFGAYLAGLFPGMAALAIAGLLSTTVAMGSIAIYASARHAQVGPARATATLLTWVWLVFPTVLARIPVASEPIWAELSIVARWFGQVVGPSSPVDIFAASALSGAVRQADAIAGMVLWMIAYQAGFIAFVIAMAILALKRQEPRRAATDGRFSYRPACGDDPIFWREFDLPQRTGSPPKLLLMAHHLAALLKLLLTVLLKIAAVAVVIAIPIALLLATVSHAVPAFREAWLGAGSGRSARDAFGTMIAGVSLFVALICLLGGTAAATGRITNERDRSTWLPLLTTPLDGRELLTGKMRATARSHWGLVRVLPPIWLVGIVCDSVHPLGPVLFALDFAVAEWLAIALGTWLGVRPGSTSSAAYASALGALGIVVVNAPYLFLCLLYGRLGFELTVARQGGAWVVPALVGLLIAVPVVDLTLARWLTRRTFDRFDRYVDRPRRPGT